MINEKEQILELFDLAIAQLVSGEKSNLLEYNLNHLPKNELEKSLALFDRLIHKPDSDTLLNKTFSNKADKIESKELANALERFHTSDKKDTIRRLIVEEKHEIQKISCFLILLNKSLNFFLYFLISFIVTYIINLGDGIV